LVTQLHFFTIRKNMDKGVVWAWNVTVKLLLFGVPSVALELFWL